MDDRVREHTPDHVNADLDEQRMLDVAAYVGADPRTVSARLAELDQEWDVERVLQVNAATLTLTSVLLGAVHSRRWLLLGAVVPAFLLQHALQGWCPPVEVVRRMGVRTRKEIDVERTALKAIRGDFDAVSPAGATGDAPTLAATALTAAERR